MHQAAFVAERRVAVASEQQRPVEIDDMVERHVSRRDREQPAAPPEAKSPRNSRNSQVSASVRVIE